MLGRGQSIEFLVSDEIAEKVTSLNGVQKNDELRVMHILRWAIRETWRESEKSIGLYAMQGIRHQVHEVLWKDLRNSTVAMRKQFAHKFLEKEAQTLAQRYSPPKRENIFKRETARPLLEARREELKLIEKRCGSFGVISMHPTRAGEEQERELAPEREEQRQLQKPVALAPLRPDLHDDVLKFARCGIIDTDRLSEAFIPAFKIFEASSVRGQKVLSQFPCDLLATREFARTVDSQQSRKFISDHYLRPVHWVMTSTTKDGNVAHMVLLSSWEANELLLKFTKDGYNDHVRLHMYAPRVSPLLRSLEDLALYTTPALPHNWVVPLQLIRLLNLFAGQLFLRSYAEYTYVCDFLGLPHRLDGNALPDMKTDGFLGDNKHADCPFSESPVPFLRALLQDICRDNQDIKGTDMGRILAGDLLTEDDFRERPEDYQLPKSVERRRADGISQDTVLPAISNRHRVKHFVDIFERDLPVFPMTEYYTRSGAPGFAQNTMIEEGHILEGVTQRAGLDVLTQGPIDEEETAWQNDELPTSNDGGLVTFSRHEEDATNGRTCSKCRCQLCHARRNDEREEGQRSHPRWSINLNDLKRSARQCSSCGLLYNIASHIRGRSKLAAGMELEYRSESRQLFTQLLDNNGKHLDLGRFEIYRTQEQAAQTRKSTQNPSMPTVNSLLTCRFYQHRGLEFP